MNDERNEKRTVEVVDTSDQPVERGPVVKETVAENEARMNAPQAAQENLAPLFENEAAEKFRTRWLSIQSKFVDDPQASVKEADTWLRTSFRGSPAALPTGGVPWKRTGTAGLRPPPRICGRPSPTTRRRRLGELSFCP